LKRAHSKTIKDGTRLMGAHVDRTSTLSIWVSRSQISRRAILECQSTIRGNDHMLTRIRSSIFVICLIVAPTLCCTQSPYGHYSGPQSLGLFTLSRDTPMGELLGGLGAKPTRKAIYCFADTKNGLYLYIRPMEDRLGIASQLELSSFSNCIHLPVYPAIIDPTVWKTPEGIGSTEEDVLHAYHKPVLVRRPDKDSALLLFAGGPVSGRSLPNIGEFSYLYSCLISEKQACDSDSPTVGIGFSKGKVIWIWAASSGSE
jgi:hypothetical protein